MQIKTLKDYYEDMYKLFPDVPKQDIKLILSQGWKNFYMYNSAGADVVIKDSDFWSYVGFLKKNSVEYFKYYIKKLSIKFRILYKRLKVKWDGYYYFALTDDQYKEYLGQKKPKGRKRKYFIFKNIEMFKLLDECKIRESGKKYIFKISYISDIGFRYFIRELKTDKAELIIEREPLKFKDILISENNYDIL